MRALGIAEHVEGDRVRSLGGDQSGELAAAGDQRQTDRSIYTIIDL
jgi:hypothetical protein